MEDSDHQSRALIGSNDDLLSEILIRLPVISILRFKSVSKHWRLLLSHRYFTNRYDNNNNNLSKSPGIFPRDMYIPFDAGTRTTPPFRSLYSYIDRCHVRIILSCNGLVLCIAVHNATLECYVFNPTTKQLALIPPVSGGKLRFFALAFHQTDCVQYKVVCILELEKDENLFQIQMYSSETGKWKICVESFFAQICTFGQPVYWKGAVYWAPDFQSGNSFLYFKLDVEQLQTLPVPEGFVSYEISTMYVGESGGHLHLILRKDYENNLRVNVYEMLSDHSRWFVKYQVQLDGIPGAFPEMVNQYDYELSDLSLEVVDVVRGKEEEDTFLVLVTNGKLIRYNIHDKNFYLIHTDGYFYERYLSFHRYIELLSSF